MKKIIRILLRWFKNNKTRSIPILGFIIAVIFALIDGSSAKIQGVLSIALWFTPLLLLPEIKKWIKYYNR